MTSNQRYHRHYTPIASLVFHHLADRVDTNRWGGYPEPLCTPISALPFTTNGPFTIKCKEAKMGKKADNSFWITASGSRVTFRPLPCMFWTIPLDEQHDVLRTHGDVIKWKNFPRYWPFVRGIHRSPVNSPHKGQWCRALIFSLICVWINSWVNKREAGDLRRYRAHYHVIVMISSLCIANGRTCSS